MRTDPRDPYIGQDNYNVDMALFDAVKRDLRGIAEREARFPVDCNLWLVLTREPLRVHMAMRQVNNRTLYWEWAQMYRDPDPAMLPVLAGERAVAEKDDLAAALEPIVAADGTVIGFFEVCAAGSDFAAVAAR
jgi:hypothetical protein